MSCSTTQTQKQNYFLSQPHQPFFVLGIVNAIVVMLLFALNYKGVVDLHTNTLNIHVYTMIFMVFTNVFTGFLFTTFPRFCQSATIDKAYYTKIFYGNVLGTLLFVVGALLNFYIVIASMLILFTSQAFIVYKLHAIYTHSVVPAKEDQYWIMMAQYFGIFSHLLFLLSLGFEGLQNLAVTLSFYMYLIFLTFSVAQRMIPFFAHSFEQKDPRLVSTVFVLFLAKSLLMLFNEYTFIKVAEIILDLLLALYLLNEFLRWKLPLFTSQPIMWVLFLGLFWLPSALFIGSLSLIAELFLDTSFYFLDIHLIAIGFLTTILIGFGTRVTLGHAGQSPHADSFATNLFWFVQVVVIMRALYSVNIAFGWDVSFLFDIAFSAWLLLFIAWGARYAKVLIFGSKL